MANIHPTLTSLFEDIADAIRNSSPITEKIKADVFPAYIRMLDYTGDIPETPSILDSCSWNFIRWASDEGIADLIWSVGDRKSVSIGAFGNRGSQYQINPGVCYCYILEFDHNASVEGTNRIHFEFGFNTVSEGTHIAFTGGDYSLSYPDTSTVYLPRMNLTNSNSGGWKSSTMRTGTLNGTTRSFASAAPNDLKNVIKPTTKYTDNVGNGSGSVASNVSSTVDSFFILNVVEVYGTTHYINRYEANYTKQYQYYKNGNSMVHYRSDKTTEAAYTWTRSPIRDSATDFVCKGGAEGYYGFMDAYTCRGIAPAFCV